MPANRFNGFTELGIGIGLRIPHYAHILSKKPTVDWFEIISENYMCDAGRPLEVLDQILEQYQVIQHGVALYFGSTDRMDREQLKRLKTLVKRTNTPFLSDHLCWGSVDGTYTHDLLPMPYTFAAAKNTARRIREVQDFLEIPIIVENVSSYAEFHVSEMTEWEFLTEVVELADCGILLDVNNIYVSSKNHGFRPIRLSERTSPTIASGRCTSPGTANTRNIFSTRTIIRCSIRSGKCTPTRSSNAARPPHFWNGTPISPLSRKCIAKRSRRRNS